MCQPSENRQTARNNNNIKLSLSLSFQHAYTYGAMAKQFCPFLAWALALYMLMTVSPLWYAAAHHHAPRTSRVTIQKSELTLRRTVHT